jgi:Ca2+-binding RTX toxin-like protein
MGREFRVNTYQDNRQGDAHITTFADGSFLVVWESYFNNFDGDPSATYIASQRYDANGVRVGGERIIDFVDEAASQDARATSLSDGGYAVVYCFDNVDDITQSDEKIYVNIYNANGTLRTADIRVDTVPSSDALTPEVFATANGGFKVLFGVYRPNTLSDQIYSQQFTANGTKVGGNTLVNTNVGEFAQTYTRSATLANGSTITIWNSEGSFPTDSALDRNEVRGTITNVNGTVVRGDFSLSDNYGTVGGGNGAGYDVSALSNGGFIISHINYGFELGLGSGNTSYYTIFRTFNSAGRATSGKIIAFASDDQPDDSRVAQLATGEIVVVWSQDPLPAQQQISDDIYGRVFSANGTPITGVFEVSVDANSRDRQSVPEIAALAGGGFIVTYTSGSADNDSDGIAARIFGRATAGNDRVTVDQSGMMLGLAGNDTITGSGRSNTIMGGDGSDRASGLAGDDRMGGGAGSDVLSGGDGRDRLSGGLGMDTLTGGTGADSFVFANTASPTNHDVITAFSSVDILLLDNAIFRALGAVGTLAPGLFKMIGTGASADANDRLIYDKRTGVLYYDTNGSADGGRFAIADFDNRPTLTAGDIHII